MNFKLKSWCFITFFLPLAVSAQIPAPAPKQSKRIILLGGTIHIGNGKVIENGAIIFENGKITGLADATTVRIDTTGARLITTYGKHIYPGIILTNTTLGLNRIDAVRATHDMAETGELNPNVRSLIAYDTDNEIGPTIRTNGILLAQITPRGGLLSGQSSVVQLDAWNWEDAAYKTDEGIHLNWPGIYPPSEMAEKDRDQFAKNRKKALDELEKIFLDAQAYLKISSKDKITNLKLEAMTGFFDSSKTLYLHATYAKDLVEATQFALKYGVKKFVLVGAAEADKIIPLLQKYHIPVILRRLHSLPLLTDDPTDRSYVLPSILQKAGILFALSYEGEMEVMGARNLPFTAGTAVGYGLTKEEALSAITLNPAIILGISSTAGSLEKGKEAHLFVSDGDALDMKENNVIYAFISGREISLENRQKALYEKFKKKDEGK